MLAVTSFSPKGFQQYGKKCLEGLVECFPGRIVAYHEELPDWADTRVEFRDFFGIKDAVRFLDRIKKVAGADGQAGDTYDYRFDCSRFCRKSFVQDAVFDEDEHVFWIDADCVFYKPMPEEFLRGLLKDVALCYMGRGREKTYAAYTETGFVGFSTKHPDFGTFRSKYLSYFTTGKIFSQIIGWHDCIAFDYARQGVAGRNLSPKGTGMNSVIETTVLAEYMDHNKGRRKFEAAA